jgi:hypothetical protein
MPPGDQEAAVPASDPRRFVVRNFHRVQARAADFGDGACVIHGIDYAGEEELGFALGGIDLDLASKHDMLGRVVYFRAVKLRTER